MIGRISNLFSSLIGQIRQRFPRLLSRDDSHHLVWRRWLAPASDIRETPEKFVYEIDLPGIERKDIRVNTYGNLLTIRAESKRHRSQKNANWLWNESLYGSFATSFTLPDSVDPESVRADYSGGVLTIEAAKKAWARPKRIPVQSGGRPLSLQRAA
jgi:HSP20 family protein